MCFMYIDNVVVIRIQNVDSFVEHHRINMTTFYMDFANCFSTGRPFSLMSCDLLRACLTYKSVLCADFFLFISKIIPLAEKCPAHHVARIAACTIHLHYDLRVLR